MKYWYTKRNSPLYALTEPVSFRFVRGGVGSFAFYIFIDKSLQLKVRSCDAYRDVVTVHCICSSLCVFFKLIVYCDLPLKKDLAFKHLRTFIYQKMSPRQVPSDSGYFCIRHSLMIPLDTGIWGCLNDILVILLCTSIILTSILRKILHFFLKRQILVRFIPNWIVSILDIFACISKLFLNLRHSECTLFIVTWCH